LAVIFIVSNPIDHFLTRKLETSTKPNFAPITIGLRRTTHCLYYVILAIRNIPQDVLHHYSNPDIFKAHIAFSLAFEDILTYI